MTNASKGMEAATAARKRLVAAHEEEYTSYLKEERTSRGLTELPTPRTQRRHSVASWSV